MTAPLCSNRIDPLVLADYWGGALPVAEEEKVEEHLLVCDVCGDSLREVSSLIDGIREMARKGTLNVVVSRAFLDRAAEQGLRIRQYAPVAGGSVNCTVTACDDLLIARLAADVASAQRVDLCVALEGAFTRFQDIPINRESKEVVLNVGIEEVRAAGPNVGKIQLVAVDEAGDRLLGEYTFNHTPTIEKR